MIKISFKLLLAISIMSSYVVADDFKAKAKFKPQYPKSAYVKRISGYAIVEFVTVSYTHLTLPTTPYV